MTIKRVAFFLFFLSYSISLSAQMPRSYLKMARYAQDEGKNAKAKRYAQKALEEEQCPQKAEAYLLLADIFIHDAFRLSDKKALMNLEAAIQCNSLHAEAYYRYGLLILHKKPEEGIQFIKKAYELNPNFTLALLELSNWASLNNDEKATILYADAGLKSLATDFSKNGISDKVQFYYQKAEAHYYSDELEEAVIALDSVIVLDSIDFYYEEIARYTRGACLNDLEEFDRALEDLTFVATLSNPKKDEFLAYHLSLAYAYKAVPDLEKALFYINMATVLNKKNRHATAEDRELYYILRGGIYLDQKNGAAALDDFSKLTLDENRAFWLGKAYLLNKNYSKALSFYLDYFNDFPDDFETIKDLATCYHHLGENEKACEYISQALEYFEEPTLEEVTLVAELVLMQDDYCK